MMSKDELRLQLAAAEKAVHGQQAVIRAVEGQLGMALRERDALRALAVQLVEALRQAEGPHKRGCSLTYDARFFSHGDTLCKCGLESALAAARALGVT